MALVGKRLGPDKSMEDHLRGPPRGRAGCSSPASVSPLARAIPGPGGCGRRWCFSSCFAWLENAYPESSVPVRVGAMALTYTVITLGGIVVFGKHQWLRHGEAFSVVFEFLSRFAPTEVRVAGRAPCREVLRGVPRRGR